MSLILNDKNFDIELKEAKLPLLVDFYADWCGPCKQIAPFIEKVEKENEGKLIVAKVNVDNSLEIVQRYGVQSIPTLLFFNKDKKIVKQSTGFQSEEVLKQLVNESLK
jgi:thioredoxin 1